MVSQMTGATFINIGAVSLVYRGVPVKAYEKCAYDTEPDYATKTHTSQSPL